MSTNHHAAAAEERNSISPDVVAAQRPKAAATLVADRPAIAIDTAFLLRLLTSPRAVDDAATWFLAPLFPRHGPRPVWRGPIPPTSYIGPLVPRHPLNLTEQDVPQMAIAIACAAWWSAPVTLCEMAFALHAILEHAPLTLLRGLLRLRSQVAIQGLNWAHPVAALDYAAEHRGPALPMSRVAPLDTLRLGWTPTLRLSAIAALNLEYLKTRTTLVQLGARYGKAMRYLLNDADDPSTASFEDLVRWEADLGLPTFVSRAMEHLYLRAVWPEPLHADGLRRSFSGAVADLLEPFGTGCARAGRAVRHPHVSTVACDEAARRIQANHPETMVLLPGAGAGLAENLYSYATGRARPSERALVIAMDETLGGGGRLVRRFDDLTATSPHSSTYLRMQSTYTYLNERLESEAGAVTTFMWQRSGGSLADLPAWKLKQTLENIRAAAGICRLPQDKHGLGIPEAQFGIRLLIVPAVVRICVGFFHHRKAPDMLRRFLEFVITLLDEGGWIEHAGLSLLADPLVAAAVDTCCFGLDLKTEEIRLLHLRRIGLKRATESLARYSKKKLKFGEGSSRNTASIRKVSSFPVEVLALGMKHDLRCLGPCPRHARETWAVGLRQLAMGALTIYESLDPSTQAALDLHEIQVPSVLSGMVRWDTKDRKKCRIRKGESLSFACEHLWRYLTYGRPILAGDSDETALFVNTKGQRLGYATVFADLANLTKRITGRRLNTHDVMLLLMVSLREGDGTVGLDIHEVADHVHRSYAWIERRYFYHAHNGDASFDRHEVYGES